LSGNLLQPIVELDACRNNINSKDCSKVLKTIHNPFHLENISGSTQSQGWMDKWSSSPSIYTVAAVNANDVAAAINFAREHNLRVVIKGTGHDYLGRSNAPDSLLIWTHNMRTVTYEDKFKPEGCEDKVKAVPAITVGAGTRWLETYDMATNQHNRYVQGGGCTTVGAAGGFTQGGGFGSFSKKYGTGAAGILQVEIVTADGKIFIANQCQNKDLFWAVRGGGAGTFGVVTKMTLKTYSLPATFGVLSGKINATSDAAYKKLIREFIAFYRDNLNNDHWGEQIKFNPDNTISLTLMFQDLPEVMARYTFSPFRTWMNDHKDEYTFEEKYFVIPANKMWNYDYLSKNMPGFVTLNNEKGAPKNQFWWTPNTAEVSKYWYAYQSWWLPANLFDTANAGKLADTIFDASRLASTTLHINKGLSGASESAVKAVRETATNPAVLDAAALIIIGAGGNKVYPGVKGKEPDIENAKNEIHNVNRAINYFKALAPDAGTYVNEADYSQENWQQAFWGDNYNKLMGIKKKYDPEGLFYCHHCVGSEAWSSDGMCRVN
jgi:FAD/FMN-containing dehydrogenase